MPLILEVRLLSCAASRATMTAGALGFSPVSGLLGREEAVVVVAGERAAGDAATRAGAAVGVPCWWRCMAGLLAGCCAWSLCSWVGVDASERVLCVLLFVGSIAHRSRRLGDDPPAPFKMPCVRHSRNKLCLRLAWLAVHAKQAARRSKERRTRAMRACGWALLRVAALSRSHDVLTRLLTLTSHQKQATSQAGGAASVHRGRKPCPAPSSAASSSPWWPPPPQQPPPAAAGGCTPRDGTSSSSGPGPRSTTCPCPSPRPGAPSATAWRCGRTTSASVRPSAYACGACLLAWVLVLVLVSRCGSWGVYLPHPTPPHRTNKPTPSDFIERHNANANAKTASYTLAHNRFSHLSFQEFRAQVSWLAGVIGRSV